MNSCKAGSLYPYGRTSVQAFIFMILCIPTICYLSACSTERDRLSTPMQNNTLGITTYLCGGEGSVRQGPRRSNQRWRARLHSVEQLLLLIRTLQEIAQNIVETEVGAELRKYPLV